MKKRILKGAILMGSAAILLAGCQAANSSSSNSEKTTTETASVNIASSKTDIAYATSSEAQKFDIYLPSTNGKLPVVLNIHGGGFMMGDKAGMAASGGGMPTGGTQTSTSEKKPSGSRAAGQSGASGDDATKTAVLSRGYAFASTNYRLSGEAA
ncbi:MAG: hypothetical protein ACRCXK_04915, partial [Wohlfahrtiimonas sp.]